MHTLALFQGVGHWELLIILAIGLLLFGRRLPEVGRSLGKGIVEFKRGLKGIEDDIEAESSKPGSKQISDQTDTVDASASKSQTKTTTEGL